MYTQFCLPKVHDFDDIQLNFQKCILAGNWMMILSFTVVVGALVVTYGFDEYFSIAIQITGHISTIIFAALIKLGYVLRCVGVHGLGYQVF